MEMNKLSSNVIKIVEKCDDFKELSKKDKKYLVKQINKLYDGFFENVYTVNITIVEESPGKHQGKGQYCNQHSVGWTGDSFEGVYYFPIEDGRYLAVEYSC